jgi:hypothetical protein
MLHLIKRFAFVISCVNLCLAYHIEPHDVKGGQYSSGAPLTKSYGGYNYDSTSNQHQPAYQTYHDQINQPAYFPFYGLNFYQQPPIQRTYGGVINHQQQFPGYGWFGGYPNQGHAPNTDQRTDNSDNVNDVIPTLPNYTPFVAPNYFPQQYSPTGQFPYPHFNLFPFGIHNNPPSYHPQQPQLPATPENPNQQQTESPSTTDFITHTTPYRGPVRFTTTPSSRPYYPSTTDRSFVSPGFRQPSTTTRFPSSGFFHDRNENDRNWSEIDEKNWRATTKAPYFENKVPGLGCTLPAAAVLGEIVIICEIMKL